MATLRKIDELLAAHHDAGGIEPAPLCDDLAFLRRITLDLAGRVPTVDEIATFETDPNRSARIDELLGRPDFSKHWSELWTAMLNGYSNAFQTDRESLRLWLEKQFRENASYDRIATELMTATGSALRNGAVNFVARYPDEASVRVSRLFLGVRLDCARCHDHPFDRWTETDFAEMTRFFDTVERRRVGNGPVSILDRVVNEGAKKPTFLTGAQPRTSQWRDEMALFIGNTNAFAKNFANRLWYQLMGRGIVHPPDDFNEENPPAVPELLEHLADRARQSKWNIRQLVSEICNSNSYRRSSSIEGDPADGARESFAVRSLKPMTPEQWFDSLSVIYEGKLPVGRDEFLRGAIGPQLDEDFSETWLYRETVQQQMQQLALDLGAPAGDLEEVYLRILGRRPGETDLRICRGEALDDVAFALIHSNEFYFHH